MNIYISDLTTICNINDLINNLSKSDLERYQSFKRPSRAKQFLIAHTIKNNVSTKFKYTSIAHKDNFVIVAASNMPVGVDIENMQHERNFAEISKFMNFQDIKNSNDFYRAFTLSEAEYKVYPYTNLKHNFYKIKNYIICIVSDDTQVIWENKLLIPEQI